MDYELIPYSPDFRSQVVDLRAAVWGGTHELNSTYFRWKYEENPYLEEIHFFLAIHKGRVVGTRGMYGGLWLGTAGASATMIPTAAELMVDKAHRGRGLAHKMLAYADRQMAENRFVCCLNVSANTSSRPIMHRVGWRLVAKYVTFRRNTSGASLTNEASILRRADVLVRGYGMARNVLRRTLRGRARKPFERFDRWAAKQNGALTGSSMPRIAQMSRLVSHCADRSRIQHARDERFYSWRFEDPRSDYRFLFHTNGDELQGFLVLHQFANGGVVTIVDWAASTSEVWAALIRTTSRIGIEPIEIASTRFSEEQIKQLHSCGFSRIDESDGSDRNAAGIRVHILIDADDAKTMLGPCSILEQDSWDMRMIYSDRY